MKTTLTLIMFRTLLAALVVGLFAGCAATRPISDVVGGAGGAYLGHELSNGDPVATAAGAAGGVILSEGLHYAAKKQAEKAYATGYDKGKSDAVKQQYWLYVSMQRQRNQISSVRLYPVQLPEQRIDGVTFQPSTKYLRIEE
ncbi:MAG TPA: glycine zipper 2TM domain-containing protein [Candidatus Binatia bacterium]|nr:glycine zipper 2TM domain-containing protein [Candidatus Binatia bacterium]